MPTDFQLFSNQLKERLKLPMPGATAHSQLLPTTIDIIRKKFVHADNARSSGVIILLYPEQGRIKFPLIKRSEYDGLHSGQVSLPGGKTELNETVEETAIRELEEEIGVKVDKNSIVGKLSDFFVIPSNFIVVPTIACTPYRPQFVPNPIEVASILECDLVDLIKDDAVRTTELTSYQTQILAPHFLVSNEIVWGATAMILNEMRLIIRELGIDLIQEP